MMHLYHCVIRRTIWILRGSWCVWHNSLSLSVGLCKVDIIWCILLICLKWTTCWTKWMRWCPSPEICSSMWILQCWTTNNSTRPAALFRRHVFDPGKYSRYAPLMEGRLQGGVGWIFPRKYFWEALAWCKGAFEMVEREQGGEVGDDILMEFRGGGQAVLCLGSGLCICIAHCATGGGTNSNLQRSK